MAMNADNLGTELKAAVDAVLAGKTPEQMASISLDVWKAMASAIVTHIQTNAQVTTTGVTAGSGSAPGTIA